MKLKFIFLLQKIFVKPCNPYQQFLVRLQVLYFYSTCPFCNRSSVEHTLLSLTVIKHWTCFCVYLCKIIKFFRLLWTWLYQVKFHYLDYWMLMNLSPYCFSKNVLLVGNICIAWNNGEWWIWANAYYVIYIKMIILHSWE